MQSTDAQVTFDRSEDFYVVRSEHNAANTSGALVLDKFDYSGASPASITRVRLNSLIAGPLAANAFDKVVYKWDNSDPAYSPTVAVDNNDPIFTDPQTHLVQTDSLATMFPVTAAGTANLAGGGVSSVTITAGGIDYAAAPGVTLISARGFRASGRRPTPFSLAVP